MPPPAHGGPPAGGSRDPRRTRPDESPFGSSLPLARIAGVTVRAHWSLLLAVALFAALLAGAVLPAAAPDRSTVAYWVTAALTSLAFFVTLLAHELAHAVAARHYGLPVERITLWMLGGATELTGEPTTPRADAVVAGIGPAVSLTIGGVLWAVLALAGGNPESLPVVALAWLAGVNVLLGVFNLLPGAPLDGGRLLRAALWWRSGDRRRAVAASSRAGRALGIGFVAFGLFEVLAGYYGGLWLALVGWFVMTSAAGEQLAESAGQLGGLRAADVMRAGPVVVPDWWTVGQFLAGLDTEQARQPAFPLVDLGGHVVGCLSAADLQRPGARPADTRLRDLARGRLLLVGPDAAVADLLRVLPMHRGIAVVVDAAGLPLGLVTAADVTGAVRLAELGWRPRPGVRDEPRV